MLGMAVISLGMVGHKNEATLGSVRRHIVFCLVSGLVGEVDIASILLHMYLQCLCDAAFPTGMS